MNERRASVEAELARAVTRFPHRETLGARRLAQGGIHLSALVKACMIGRLVNMLRRRARDLAIVAAVVVLGAVAFADALRGRTTEEARDGRAANAATTDDREASATTVEEGQDGQTSTTTTDEGEASVPRLPDEAASGLLAFTAPGACELRAIDLHSGRMLDLPRLETSCELNAPRVGTRVAYSTLDDEGFTRKPFSILDLENPRASFGDYKGYLWIAWSPDGSTLAWCDDLRSGFELSRRQRPKRLHRCPQEYDPSGVLASVNDRQEIVVGGRPLLRARRPVRGLAWGIDGSLAVLVDVEGCRVDRYEGGRLVGAARVPRSTPQHCPLGDISSDLAPDNCAALSVSGEVVHLDDLGCFQGRAPQTFKGLYADWSPNGKWIVVAEADAVVFHRVVGREASVRWNVAAGQLAWLSG
jgi:WD40-like Beta Propeller Repeat